MSVTGLRQVDDTIHTTNVWLKEIMTLCRWTERHDAYRALRVTLQSLRDHLPIETLAHLSAQLPTLIRGVLFESWQPGREHPEKRDLASFLFPIQEAFDRYPSVDAADVAKAVFEVMRMHVSAGEMAQVEHALPRQVRSILVSDI
jgi:uncharacterized protein (DUF2267 family)